MFDQSILANPYSKKTYFINYSGIIGSCYVMQNRVEPNGLSVFKLDVSSPSSSSISVTLHSPHQGPSVLTVRKMGFFTNEDLQGLQAVARAYLGGMKQQAGQ